MTQRPSPRRLCGFTLVELLVVIGIIAVLMGILIPIVGHIRLTGYVTATQAQISIIQGAIENYRQQFESYPGPLPESELKTSVNAAGLATGSENLVLGLLGGLINKNGVVTYDSTRVGSGPASLNPLKLQTYQPLIDPVAGGLDKAKSANDWVVWSDANAHQGIINGANFKDTKLPEFVDRFPDPMPILYIRARVGAAGVAKSPSVTYPANTVPAYDASQLLVYTFPDLGPGTPDFTNVQSYFGTLANTNVPRQKDGFLIISAGIDRKYGTGDDLTNGGKLK